MATTTLKVSAGADDTAQRQLGKRALATRHRLLEALGFLLAEKPGARISVADIARVADMSSATFYRYFADFDEAALALAEDLIDDLRPAVSLVAPSSDGLAGFDNVMAFVDEFLAHWERDRPCSACATWPPRKATSGSTRFGCEPSDRSTWPWPPRSPSTEREGNVVTEVQPTIAATALVGMLEQIGAHRSSYERRGHDALVRTTAVIIQQSVCGGRSEH